MSNVIMRVDVPSEVKMKVEPALLIKGLSPTIEVTDITGGHRVSITDIDGTQTFDVMNGTDAYVYIRYAASEPTQDSDMKTTPDAWIGIYSGDAASAPTAYTAYTWYKIKGETGAAGQVQDVQVNGVSVLDAQGVANVPIASGSDGIGVIRTASNSGLFMDGTTIRINKATDALIKSGDSSYFPIVPTNQHKSAFYGLAKAAGDITQSASSNAVGNYTDAAKVAIQKMLGIDVWETIADFELEQDILPNAVYPISASDNSAYTLTSFILLCYKHADQTTGATIAVRINGSSSKSFASPSNWVSKVSNGYMSFERKGSIIIPTALAQDNNNVMYNLSGGRFIEAEDITSLDIVNNGANTIVAGHRFVLLGVRK